ncbi:MAG: hypothetical protein IKH54_05480 [Bacilli bacterium]|nr:hypothetical protein [Bacilli bacterium]
MNNIINFLKSIYSPILLVIIAVVISYILNKYKLMNIFLKIILVIFIIDIIILLVFFIINKIKG